MTTIVLLTVIVFLIAAFGLAAYDAWFWRKASARWKALALESLATNQDLLSLHRKGTSHVKEH